MRHIALLLLLAMAAWSQTSITVINPSDVIRDSRGVINANFASLAENKLEGIASSTADGLVCFSGTTGKATKACLGVLFPSYTISALPSVPTGTFVWVTDAASATSLGAGGGSTRVLVWWDGAAYEIFTSGSPGAVTGASALTTADRLVAVAGAGEAKELSDVTYTTANGRITAPLFRFNPAASAPGSLANGDIWSLTDGAVQARLNSATYSIFDPRYFRINDISGPDVQRPPAWDAGSRWYGLAVRDPDTTTFGESMAIGFSGTSHGNAVADWIGDKQAFWASSTGKPQRLGQRGGASTAFVEIDGGTASMLRGRLRGVSSDPGSLENGDFWYRSDTHKFRFRQNGATVELGSGGGGGDLEIEDDDTSVGTEPVLRWKPGFGLINTFTNIPGTRNEIQQDVNTAVMLTREQMQQATDLLCEPESASGQAYACTSDPVREGAWARGALIILVPDVASGAGTVTLAVDARGAVDVKRLDGTDPGAGGLTAGRPYLLWHTGTQLRILAGIEGGGGAGAAWGDITGTLSDQTDLQTALNGKANSSHTHGAADITSGTLAASLLPVPTTTTLGGVKRNTGTSGQFVSGISTDGDLQYDTPAGGGGGSAPVFDTFASRPACASGNTGQQFFPTDLRGSTYICNGTAWVHVVAGLAMTDPPAGYTEVTGAGTMGVDAAKGPIVIDVSDVLANRNAGVVYPVPTAGATGWRVTMRYSHTRFTNSTSNAVSCGLILSEGTATSDNTLMWPTFATGMNRVVKTWANSSATPSTFISRVFFGVHPTLVFHEVRYTENATDRILEGREIDGSWFILQQQAKTTDVTATHIGFACYAPASGASVKAVLYHYVPESF